MVVVFDDWSVLHEGLEYLPSPFSVGLVSGDSVEVEE